MPEPHCPQWNAPCAEIPLIGHAIAAEHFKDRLREREATIVRLADVVERLQWIRRPGDEAVCAACKYYRSEGHALDCWIARPLADARAALAVHTTPAPDGVGEETRGAKDD